MFHRSTPFAWHFTAEDRQGLIIRHSHSGIFDLCRRSHVGPMCWESRTLSCHQSFEQAGAAADDLALVPC